MDVPPELMFVLNRKANVIKSNISKTQIPINEDGSFTFDGVEYLLYDYTTTLIKHNKNGFGDLETKYFDHLFVIRKEDAIAMIEDLINVTQFQLAITVENNLYGTTDDLVNTLQKMKNSIKKTIEDNKHYYADNGLGPVLEILMSQVENYEPDQMIKSLPKSAVRISVDFQTRNYREILSTLIKYVTFHNTFHDTVVDNRGLTVFPDTVFLLAIINCMMSSYNVALHDVISFSSKQDILIHTVIESVYNLIVMRIDRELFINERNTTAKELKNKYFVQFPVLKSQNWSTKAGALQYDSKFMDMCKAESIDIYPYIMLYSMSDKNRVKFMYQEISKNKEIQERCGQQINWVNTDKFISLLQKFSLDHSRDFCRYDPEMFSSIISQFIVATTSEDNNDNDNTNRQTENMDIE